jgi:hypothetical protein
MFSLMGPYTGILWIASEVFGRLLRLEPSLRRAFTLDTVPMNVGNSSGVTVTVLLHVLIP